MSSSSRATEKAPTQQVPSWKRLGLKLKPGSEGQEDDSATGATKSSMPNSTGFTPNGKRKAAGGPLTSDNSAKRARQDAHQGPKKGKSVAFAADTADPQAAKKNNKQQQKPKQKPAGKKEDNAPAKKTKKAAPVNLEPALGYLRTWHESRESWKFNKNHQTKLLEHVFADANETTIPAVDIDVFYEYIRGLQGGVRTRLRELARGIHDQDMEQGAAGFPAIDAADVAARRQKEYEEVITKFMTKPRTPGKRLFAEVDYVLRTTDMEMQRRVVKRMRAEVVLDELVAEETTTTKTTTANAASSSTSGNAPSGQGADGATRLQLNDGPQQRTKRKRKARTAVVEDTSSESESDSDSESESDSDTSSSGSSSSDSSSSEDSDSDEDDAASRSRENEDSSSSSSSSSESESSESESDDDSDED